MKGNTARVYTGSSPWYWHLPSLPFPPTPPSLQGKHSNYGNSRMRSLDRFSVLHFAGEVSYSVSGFLEKNSDTLYTDLEELMVKSSYPLAAEIFSSDPAAEAAEERLLGAVTGGAAGGAGGAGAGKEDSGVLSPVSRKGAAATGFPVGEWA